LLSGTLGFVLSNPDAFASGQDRGNDQGKGEGGHDFDGCPIASASSERKTQNPHCTECVEACVDAAQRLRCAVTGGDPRDCENFDERQAEIKACILDQCTQ